MKLKLAIDLNDFGGLFAKPFLCPEGVADAHPN